MAYRTLHQLQASGRRASARRGAVLLIVLTLLVLFVLIGVTFVLVATRYYGGAKLNAKKDEQGDPPRKLLEEVLGQVLRGPVAEQNGNVLAPHSCLWNQDLLGDLYNKDGVIATVTGAGQTPNTGGQFFSIGITTAPPFSLSAEAGEYAGRVLTILNGDAVGISTRITGYTSGGGNSGTLTVEALKSERVPLVTTLPVGTRVLINGACFNGTGAGYSLGGALGYQRTMAYGMEAALMPNFSRYDNTQWNTIRNFQVNEPYDAVDFQNMYLAMISSQGIIPSFHRPDLIQYWMSRGNWGDANLRARVMFRPDQTFHPQFTGSNTAFNPVTGPWDIDNDGDGIADSIWIDIGLPARAGPDGRMYKPLVAILIQDLDGRFDVNAHGNLAQLSGGGSLPPLQGGMYAGSGTPSTPGLKRGVGFGPAGIDFRHAVNNYGSLVSGRYKDAVYSLEGTPAPGNNGDDPLSYLKQIGAPSNYQGAPPSTPPGTPPSMPIVSGTYGSPSDVFDRGAVGVDVMGQPIYQIMATTDETLDDPYEINVRRGIEQGTRATDALYSVTELEALLRRYDADASKLPQRLRILVGDQNARIVTVLSSHVNVNAGMLPPSRRGNENHLHGLLGRYGITDPAQIVQLLPFEVLKGGKMNLNRRWGNGVDDNAAGTTVKNGIIDDPGEGTEMAWAPGILPGNTAPLTNYTNYGVAAAGAPIGIRAKQLYAQQLYVLAMALTDPAYLPPTNEAGLNATEFRARRIAQWAINCVDYRDADAIMTPFEYDVNLSNGWQADGNLTTTTGDERVVWGCEFPDLLLTEVSAFHDKRMKDTGNDMDSKKLRKSTDMTMQDDEDLDQWRVPQGSLFFELYCPRAPQFIQGMPGGNVVLPRELYPNGNSLDLSKTTPNGEAVWRIAISEPQEGKPSPLTIQNVNFDSAQFQPEALMIPNLTATSASLTIHRTVYFTSGLPTNADPEKSFWRREGGFSVLPGQYAVVGPRRTTRLGVLKDGTDATVATLSPQSIAIANTSVTITDVGGNPTTINNVVGVVCGANPSANFPTTGGMNISEPMSQSALAYGGATHADPAPNKTLYAEAGLDGYYDPANPDATMPVPDLPFDYKAGRPLVAAGVTASGTHANHRTAFLQRLADPTQPFNAASNPYVTIDWKPIDLTVFNGEDQKPNPFQAPVYDSLDANADWTNPPKFGTRQSICTNNNIWTQTTGLPGDSAKAGSQAYFDYNLQPTPTQGTLGTLNRPMTANAAFAGGPFPYNNAAAQPFPWLNIANRPFISAYELLQVPACAPNRLLHEFSTGNLGGDAYNGADASNFRAPYTHLLNFLRTSPAPTGGAMPAPASNLHRIFDYVEVPSHYAGTETWYNADVFGNAPAGSAAEFYRPPFNYMPKFQDPGLVNINTIFESSIWDGGNGVSGVGGGRKPLWNNVRLSRQGYADGNDSQYPSKFSNPFRPGWAADLVPLDITSFPEVDVTLLRRPTPGGGTVPLFAETTTTNQYEAVDRHSHFRYEPLVAIGNRVKFTSNVFAVWTTVGFFEVEATAPTQQIPDGWRLGAELGVDTGEMTRHRAFYIIDRSIPVAYQPGEAHNTERCILLRRYLE